MNIPAFSINNYRLTVMAFITLLVLGIASFQNMPRSEDPVLDMPNIMTIAIYPGANPTDIERQVADPIEEAINTLEDIKEMKTTIRDGVCVIMTEFDYGVDVGDKEEEIQRQVNNIRGELPNELYDLTIEKFTTANVKVFQIALVSGILPYQKMKSEGERVKKVIEKVKGVRKVEIEAYPDREVRIALNPVKMTEMGISLDDIENAIRSNNANIPGGAVKVSNKLFNVTFMKK